MAGWVDAKRRVVYAHSFPIFLMIAVKMLNFLFYNFTLRDDDEEMGKSRSSRESEREVGSIMI